MRGWILSWPMATAMAAVGLGAAIACSVALAPLLRPRVPSYSKDGPKSAETPAFPAAPPAMSVEAAPGADGTGPIQLRNVTRDAGVTFVHTHGGSGKRFIVETVSAGLATFDYDGDGLTDIYFLNGSPLPGTKLGQPVRNALYRNLGNLRFVEVTDKAGAGDPGFGMWVAVADHDNDGLPDVYVSNSGPNVLFHNTGDGTFTDATTKAGVGRGNRVGAGVCFLDIDGDGNLDLFAANYVKFTFDHPATRFLGGYLRYPGPSEFEPEHNVLFRNQGDGVFLDVTLPSGVASVAGTGMGVVAGDFDNDGDDDLFVANDLGANSLFRNNGRGEFQEDGVAAGVAYNFEASATGSMGADCGDYNNDGWLDIFMTTYQAELPCLYRNHGHGVFEDVTVRANAGVVTLPYINWGCGLVDFDNDGFKDLYVGNGHLEEFIDKIDRTTTYAPGDALLRNTGDGRFVDVTMTAGDGMLVRGSTRGVAFDDLDNDGRIDVTVLHSCGPAAVLRNETRNGNRWIQLRLQGAKTNRDGVGARVRVVSGALVQVDEVHSGRGYQSHWGSRLHFGLGNRERVDRIEVRWMGGGVDVFEDSAANRLVTLTEGTGRR